MDPAPSASPWRDRLFWFAVVVSGVFRLSYVVLFKRDQPVLGDQIYYSGQAVTIARGRWFEDPFRAGVYAADHVPLTSLSVAVVSWFPDPLFWQRMLMAIYGTMVVLLVVLARLGRGLSVW